MANLSLLNIFHLIVAHKQVEAKDTPPHLSQTPSVPWVLDFGVAFGNSGILTQLSR